MLLSPIRRALVRAGGVATWWRRLSGLAYRRLGLRGTVLALYLASGMTIMLVTALLYAGNLAESISQQYRERALAIWQVLDATYPSAEDLRGPLVQERIDRLKQTNPDVHELHLYAPVANRFLVVASTKYDLLGQPAGLDDLQPMLQDRPIWREFSRNGQAMLEMGAPLHAAGRPSGVLGVHFRLDPRDALIRQQLTTFFVITGLGGTLLLLVLYWEFNRVVLQPLFFLQRQASAIAGGDLSHRTDIRRSDEVGQLAAGFDRMAEALAQREGENLALQQELRTQYEEAEQRAVLDPITDLYNHRHFYERLAQEIARARRFSQPVALLFCDLDHFKSLNDTYGHQAGDQVLKTVAAVLRGTVREIDIIARYGGEEFTVILPNTGEEGAFQAAERIRFQVGTHAISLAGGSVVVATLSIGIACYPADAFTGAELVHCADLAMYHAKRLGRNQMRTYQEMKELLARQDSASAWEKDVVFFEAVQSLAAAVDVRDNYTHRHSATVSRYATALARAIGLEGEALMHVSVAGLLHDVGKIGVPDQILRKPGPLTEEEWQQMRQHPVVGKHIVQHMSSHEQVLPLILHHHERWDGKGYPEGLTEEAIPLGARILTVADAYHAMTSDRPYRRAFSREQALEILGHEAGKQFDPQVVKAFLQLSEESLFGATEPLESSGDDHENRSAATF